MLGFQTVYLDKIPLEVFEMLDRDVGNLSTLKQKLNVDASGDTYAYSIYHNHMRLHTDDTITFSFDRDDVRQRNHDKKRAHRLFFTAILDSGYELITYHVHVINNLCGTDTEFDVYSFWDKDEAIAKAKSLGEPSVERENVFYVECWVATNTGELIWNRDE